MEISLRISPLKNRRHLTWVMRSSVWSLCLLRIKLQKTRRKMRMSNVVKLAEAKEVVKNTYTFTMLVEAKLANPNGDPDMGNLPRQDLETEIGIITDVAFKRRIRNYIDVAYAGEDGMGILMRNGVSINKEIAKIVLEVNGEEKFAEPFKNKKVPESAAAFCKRFWDVRTFGGVLSTGRNAGQITGPVQLGMAESVDPIHIEDMTITRMCYTDGNDFSTIEDYEREEAEHDEQTKRTMGEKKVVSYGLYVVQGTISPSLAIRTGFSEDDLNKLFEALLQMYEFDNSASKQGMRAASPLIIFKHIGTHPENPEHNEKEALLGCMPAHKLYNMLRITKKEGVEYPRKLEDYDIAMQIPETMRGIDIGVKENPFGDIIWRNESTDEFSQTLENNGIQVK
ncbi:type I-C CRISPR-associated protein Cas7/Csd2 [Clostridium sp. AF37-5AT]|nr:type I-C CRISPR-associated protein Cas7/Csd2 [Clostridium sp. AF37-5AT]